MRHLAVRGFEWPGAAFKVAMSGLICRCPSHQVARKTVASRGNGHCWDKNVQYCPTPILRPSRSPSAKSAIHKLINLQPCDLGQPDILLANANYYWLLGGQNSYKNTFLEIDL